jgi:hypothetical protein
VLVPDAAGADSVLPLRFRKSSGTWCSPTST